MIKKISLKKKWQSYKVIFVCFVVQLIGEKNKIKVTFKLHEDLVKIINLSEYVWVGLTMIETE